MAEAEEKAKLEEARNWKIHSEGTGWYAWNTATRERLELIEDGSFVEAIHAFEEKTGLDYYASRPRPWVRPKPQNEG